MNLTKFQYDVLKKIAMVWLPALGTLYFALSEIWHLPDAEQVVGTIGALVTFLGVVLHINTKAYNAGDNKYDGVFTVDHNDDGTQNLRLLSVDPHALNNNAELLFKIQDPGSKTGVAS